jgi:site-specific DNA recombinase
MVVDQLKYAQIERMNISERTTRGLAFRRKKQMATSHTPYGWKRVDGSTQMVEDETEKVFVNKILSMNNEGICDSQIAKHLTSINAPTKKGGKWHPITVTKIINYHTLCQAK